MSLSAGNALFEYHIKRILGQGAFGSVPLTKWLPEPVTSLPRIRVGRP